MKRYGYSAERFSYIILRKGRENQKESKTEKNVFFHIALIMARWGYLEKLKNETQGINSKLLSTPYRH